MPPRRRGKRQRSPCKSASAAGAAADAASIESETNLPKSSSIKRARTDKIDVRAAAGGAAGGAAGASDSNTFHRSLQAPSRVGTLVSLGPLEKLCKQGLMWSTLLPFLDIREILVMRLLSNVLIKMDADKALGILRPKFTDNPRYKMYTKTWDVKSDVAILFVQRPRFIPNPLFIPNHGPNIGGKKSKISEMIPNQLAEADRRCSHGYVNDSTECEEIYEGDETDPFDQNNNLCETPCPSQCPAGRGRCDCYESRCTFHGNQRHMETSSCAACGSDELPPCEISNCLRCRRDLCNSACIDRHNYLGDKCPGSFDTPFDAHTNPN